ncbi:MAG: transcription-repair coupling factor [Lachnospiraceae bacterium]|nr:transcription-repair coupling factor [Lachnospiraceae bacterium]
MRIFKEPLLELAEIAKLNKALDSGTNTYELSGCIDAVRPAVINALSRNKTVVITRDDSRARELYSRFLSYDEACAIFPGKDIIFYQSDIRGNALTKERMNAINGLLGEDKVTVFLSVEGLINAMPPKEVFCKNSLKAEIGDTIDLKTWRKELVKFGFDNVKSVDHPGEFAVRGGIMDVYPLTAEKPYRIELFGDEVDSIRTFSPESQTSVSKVDSVKIDPAGEVILSDDDINKGLNRIEKEAKAVIERLKGEKKISEAGQLKKTTDEAVEEIRQGWGFDKLESYMPYFIDKTYTILDYLDDDALVILDDARGFSEEIKVLEMQFKESMIRRLEKGYLLPKQLEMIKGADVTLSKLKGFKKLIFSAFDNKIKDIRVDERFLIKAVPVANYRGSFEGLVKDLEKYKKSRTKVVITSASRTKSKRLARDLSERDLNAYYSEKADSYVKDGEVFVSVADIDKGFELTECGYILITENDIFGDKAVVKKKRRKKHSGEKFRSLQDINSGDYVVHENHGVGIYKGLHKVEVEGVQKDYIKIEYSGKSYLYIPASSFDVIQKYGGSESRKPKLDKLGGTSWTKTKQNVEKAVGEVAKELVELYALRQQNTGYVYSKDTVWQKEFEETFPYEETEGQLEAIEAVKEDMESNKIMDRLICGDVGYGKTEIAIRGAFKAVQDNKQVVMLCPTTILAQQHYNTFTQRMKDYPVNVELLCRFRTTAQQRETVKNLKSGKVDIVIATHRALSKDVTYKDLGLLIIDEEQRFGVRHKDKIKALKKNVDVMCLSATPIPRTLHMSLIGIRDMSVLEEAPLDRMPVQTFVFEYNEEMVRDAILREIHRGGQVYYVYNRINTIPDMAKFIKDLVPEANVEYAHGRMSETRLEEIMSDFVDGEIDVLISTTIIEIGMDIPNVNTMIIHDAEKLGLSQLYQLRGRIGRSNRMAYAFFMYKKDKILKEVAEKRLSAIKEFSDLGSGYKIALRDLEIRGAGNLLGKEQHGHMEAVGYDLYCKMLNNAVRVEKGDTDSKNYNVEIDIDLDAYIPEDYITDEIYKLDMYKRISEIRDEEDCEKIKDEMIDRFGEMSRSVSNLLYIAMIKYNAYNAYVTRIKQQGEIIRITMYNKAKLDPGKIPALIEKYFPYITFSANPKEPEFEYNPIASRKEPIKDIYDYMLEFLKDLQEIKL